MLAFNSGVLPARAAAELQAPTTIALENATSPHFVTAADVNGDGNLDLVTANTQSNSVSVLLNNGDGTFQAPKSFPSGGLGPRSLFVGQFTGDTNPDIAVANADSTQVGILRGNGNGTFEAPAVVTVGGNAGWIGGGNVDGGATTDLAVILKDKNQIQILLGDGNGGFAPSQTYPTGQNPRQLIVKELSNDGKADIVVTNLDGNVSIYEGNGDGTFAPHNFKLGNAFIQVQDLEGIVSADFNNNQKNDLAITRLAAPGSGLFAIPNVGVAHDYNPQTNQPTVDLTKQKSAGNVPHSITVGDINGDGILDLITANVESKDVSVLTGIGDGFFNNPTHHAGLGGGLVSVAVADFDKNGKVDIVAAEPSNHRLNFFRNGAAGPPPCNFAGFTDVPLGHIFYNSIKCLACRNIFTATTGAFQPGFATTWAEAADWVSKASGKQIAAGPNPNAVITRGELAKMVSDAAGWTDAASGASFPDVPANHPYFAEIERLKKNAGVAGFPCGASTEPCLNNQPTNYFRPGAAATRGQAARILQLAFFKECGASETVSKPVAPGNNIKVDFGIISLNLNVTAGGQITIQTLDLNLFLPFSGQTKFTFPVGYTIASESLAFELTSSAQLTGDQEVCIDLANSPQLQQLNQAKRLKILHGEGEGNLTLVDRTTQTTNKNLLCGKVSSFSPFIIAVAPGRGLGDVTGDGTVNVADAVETLKASVGQVTLDDDQTYAGDVDASGAVNVADAVKILRVTIKLDPDFGGP
ncbi:MAG: VCBS repeat-containing protein [Armatimonadetes bacterium]|nr:VCBS repeat-containing protein [Armatimonadota bacterium]